MFARQVRLARLIASFLEAHPKYELLAKDVSTSQAPDGLLSSFQKIHIIVIFRAKDNALNKELVKRINTTRKMYVSGTKWKGESACRIAVSTWKVDIERDLELVSKVLEGVFES